jgi:hypothetical protein
VIDLNLEKQNIFVTDYILNEQNDCNSSKQFENIFDNLRSFTEEILDGKCNLPLTSKSFKSVSESGEGYSSCLISAIQLRTNSSYLIELGHLLDQNIPFCLIAEKDIPCEFIKFHPTWINKKGYRFSCIKREVEMIAQNLEDIGEDNITAINEWSKKTPCQHGYCEDKLPFDIKRIKDNEAKTLFFLNGTKPCDECFHENTSDPRMIRLSETIRKLNDRLKTVRKTYKIPITRLSNFINMVVWLYCIGDDLMTQRIKRQVSDIETKMEIKMEALGGLLTKRFQGA